MSFTFIAGTTPLLVSMPHVGTELPPDLRQRLVPRAALTEDTDWFLDRLYGFVTSLGAGVIVPRESRYVIDLNRPRENLPMYPGRNNTELCPTRFFTGEPLYLPGQAPTQQEIEQRIADYWVPYHQAIEGELNRLKRLHGHAVLFDAHSIKGELPWLFEGRLPDMNLGTVEGHSCAASLREAVAAVFSSQTRYSHVMDGRFKGGHITRHFGRPNSGLHAVQLEMCWGAYMDETPPYQWNEAKAQEVTPLLTRLIQTLAAWRPV